MALNRYNISSDLPVEPSPQDSINRIHFSPPQSFNMDLSLGSSGDRSAHQRAAAHKLITDQLISIPSGDPIIFTDGSALGNPGPCGAAAICYLNGFSSQPVILSKPIAPISTSYHGELAAIDIVVKYLCDSSDQLLSKTIHLFCDCRAAIMAISSAGLHKTHQNIIDNILAACTSLQSLNFTVNLYWTPGHIQLKPNELADQEAKKAAFMAQGDATNCPVSFNVIKGRIKTLSTSRWQQTWTATVSNPVHHDCFPSVPSEKFKSKLSRKQESLLLRFKSGHTKLRDHMFKILGPIRVPDPSCPCGLDRETTTHILMHCPFFEEQRVSLISKFESIYRKHNIHPASRLFTFQSCLNPIHLPKAARTEATSAVASFLVSLNKAL
jgi:ribonuclease HI